MQLYFVEALNTRTHDKMYVRYNSMNRCLELSNYGDIYYFTDPAKAEQAARDYRPRVSGVVGVSAPDWRMQIGVVCASKPNYRAAW